MYPLQKETETWLPRTMRRLRYSTTFLPQSSPATPATPTKPQKTNAGTEKMKNCPLYSEEPEQVAQRSCGCLIPGSVQDQAAWGFEQPGAVEGIPAHVRGVGIKWFLLQGLFQAKPFYNQVALQVFIPNKMLYTILKPILPRFKGLFLVKPKNKGKKVVPNSWTTKKTRFWVWYCCFRYSGNWNPYKGFQLQQHYPPNYSLLSGLR